jgi:methyl-accepting chemotaxis protein
MRNLHQMRQNLNQMVRQIAASVDGVASSSEELSAVSSQTSSSLQSQGQEIEQAATAVNEMTAAVDEVARNAVSTSEASRLSEQTAHADARRSRKPWPRSAPWPPAWWKPRNVSSNSPAACKTSAACWT